MKFYGHHRLRNQSHQRKFGNISESACVPYRHILSFFLLKNLRAESWAFPSSRPMSPMEQHDIMNAIESEISKFIQQPSETDMRRYNYYIEKGTSTSMVAPLPSNQFEIFYSKLNDHIKNSPFLKPIRDELRKDIILDHEYAMRKAIVDYVLLNMDERARVKIEWIPRPFPVK